MVHENVEKIRIAKGVTKTHIANKLNMSLQGYRHITCFQSMSMTLNLNNFVNVFVSLGSNYITTKA